MRLTIKRNGKNVIPQLMAVCGLNLPGFLSGDAADKLAAYEDAEEQGLLVRIPCKVGDTVYDRAAEPYKVISVEWFSRKVTQIHAVSLVTGWNHTFSVGKRSLGKTVFLTAKEAEAALKGEREDV